MVLEICFEKCVCVGGEWVWAGRAGDLGTHTKPSIDSCGTRGKGCVCVRERVGVGGFVSEGAVERTQSLLCFHKTCGMCEQKQMCLI